MPRKTVLCDNVVLDALAFDRYHGESTNASERRKMLSIIYKAMNEELTLLEFKALSEYYINGKKMKDIADERGVNPSTVTRQIRRAKDKILHIAKYY